MTDPKQEQTAAHMAQLLKTALEGIYTPQQCDYRRMVAISKREQYLEYVRAGFNEVQALELCK